MTKLSMDEEDNEANTEGLPSTSKERSSPIANRSEDGQNEIEPQKEHSGETGSDETSSKSSWQTEVNKLATVQGSRLRALARNEKKLGQRGSRDKGKVNNKKRQSSRRLIKTKRKESVISESTVESVMSTRSSREQCEYCRNRYQRRFRERSRNSTRGVRRRTINRRSTNKKINIKALRKKSMQKKILDLKDQSTQNGSRSSVLSPLFIKSNAYKMEQPKDHGLFNEITPEMIVHAIGRISMWRDLPTTKEISKFIQANYPVNQNTEELMAEMQEKLNTAAIVGIVSWESTTGGWRLIPSLQSREMLMSHVTKFWEVYGDTMRPVVKEKRSEKILKEHSGSVDNDL